MTADDLPLRLTIPEVAVLARRDVSTVYKDVKGGLLSANHTAGHRRGLTVDRDDALAYARGEVRHEDGDYGPPPAADPPTEPSH